MDYYFTRWESKNIHESSPSNNLISQYCNHYTSSQYFSDIAEGSVVNGLRCENLESLTFPDNSFDIFITQDVLEHVFNPNIAVNEIMRVLKPGGVHIFTAPKHKGMALSKPRAILVGEDVDYLDEPMYHGNPIGDGKSLVTWDYGNDFEELISKWSNASTTTYVTRDRKLGLDGEYLEVFVTKKNNN